VARTVKGLGGGLESVSEVRISEAFIGRLRVMQKRYEILERQNDSAAKIGDCCRRGECF
jgi:hypothetical protein